MNRCLVPDISAGSSISIRDHTTSFHAKKYFNYLLQFKCLFIYYSLNVYLLQFLNAKTAYYEPVLICK